MTLQEFEQFTKNAAKGVKFDVNMSKPPNIPTSPQKPYSPKKTGKEKKLHPQLESIKTILTDHNLSFIEEYQFAPPRKFRFDIAIPHLKIAIEYEGLFSEKSRHLTYTGYSNDCNKYNLAAFGGWKVLRYTAKNFGNFSEDINMLVGNGYSLASQSAEDVFFNSKFEK